MQAAADAALDQRYESQSRSHVESSHLQQSASPGGATPNSRGITRSFSNILVDRAALGLDRKAHYLRVSLNLLHGGGLLTVVQFMLLSLLFAFLLQLIFPDIRSSLNSGYESLYSRVTERLVEVA